MAKKRFYDARGMYEKGKKLDCSNLAVAGGKSIGKTYGFLQLGIDLYLGKYGEGYKGRIIRYARRLKESVKRDNLISLFGRQREHIKKMTDGLYDDVTMIGRRFYMCSRSDDGKLKRKDKNYFAVVNALSTWETDSGADEGEAAIIIYDEAISRERAIPDEFDKLMKYRSNCMRDRTDYYCPVVMLGNTVTRDSQLLEFFGINLWDIDEDEPNIVQYIKNRKGQINCIFEWCGKALSVQDDMAEYYDRFESAKTKMITDGAFEIGEYKTMIPETAEIGTDCVLKVCFIHAQFKLIAEYRVYRASGDLFIYVRSTDHADGCDLYIKPTARTCNGNLLNFFDNRAAEIFRDCWITNNVIFDKPMTGEKYRSFAQQCIGLASCVPD